MYHVTMIFLATIIAAPWLLCPTAAQQLSYDVQQSPFELMPGMDDRPTRQFRRMKTPGKQPFCKRQTGHADLATTRFGKQAEALLRELSEYQQLR
jgi:hypothetical protein